MPERRGTQYSVRRLTLKAELSASTLLTVRSRTGFFPEKVKKIENISNEMIRPYGFIRACAVCDCDSVVVELDRVAEPLRFSDVRAEYFTQGAQNIQDVVTKANLV